MNHHAPALPLQQRNQSTQHSCKAKEPEQLTDAPRITTESLDRGNPDDEAGQYGDDMKADADAQLCIVVASVIMFQRPAAATIIASECAEERKLLALCPRRGGLSHPLPP